MNYNCFRATSASLLGSATAMASADNTERATRLNFFGIYEIGIAFFGYVGIKYYSLRL